MLAPLYKRAPRGAASAVSGPRAAQRALSEAAASHGPAALAGAPKQRMLGEDSTRTLEHGVENTVEGSQTPLPLGGLAAFREVGV